MTRQIILALAISWPGAALAALDAEPEFIAARSALADGLGSVAALKAERLLGDGSKRSKDETATLAAMAVEGWLRAKDGQRALSILDKHKIQDDPFWRGLALMKLERLEEAEATLRKCDKSSPMAERALMAIAQIEMAGGRDGAARKEVKDLRNSQDTDIARRARLLYNELELEVPRIEVVADRLSKEKDNSEPGPLAYLRARVAMEQGDYPSARKGLTALLKTSTGGMRLHHAATVLLAEVQRRSGKPTEASKILLQFLEKTTNSDFSNEAFETLSRARDAEQRKDITPLPSAVLDWIADSTAPQRQAYALFLAARWLSRQDRKAEAAGLLEALLAIAPGHRKESETMRLLMEIYGGLNADQRVLALSQSWRKNYGGGASSEVDFVTGKILFSRTEYGKATDLFRSAAELSSNLADRRRALYNAGICALKAGEVALFQTLLAQLQNVSTDPQPRPTSGETAEDLELDRALEMAAKGTNGAERELERFAQENPNHPRRAEAKIAQAEMALLDVPARVKAAEEALADAEKQPNLTEHLQQRIAYTRLWASEAVGDLKTLTQIGLGFLKKWPEAPLAAEIRMKVADAYFRMEDMANARTQFEIVALDYPDSPYADTALFFAGRAAMVVGGADSLNTAIEIWEELADRGGPLAFEARHQQAVAKRREGSETEALKVIESLLTDTKVNTDMRRSLICEKAEILQLLGAKDPKLLEEAVKTLGQLAAEKNLPFDWLARASSERASALRALGKPDEALEACYSIVQKADYDHPGTPTEFVWFYKAGFLAVDLLVEKQQWEAAARTAERIAQTSGDRATEAKDLATKIRLDHYLWDETK
ncbi:MAG: tetratricopeptide repeat protein [Verrucomicrobiales bacterium]|nr:tetratricopeptide repeat protein [Verrucomicrobiales bacterium]MCP5560388.1 tetratricopeptide repeat protein [Verrucomicrobiaceae bacterium]